MRFAYPQVLWLILAVPMLILFGIARLRGGRRALESGLSPEMAARMLRHLEPRRRIAGVALMSLALFFLIMGAARPQRGTQYVTAARRGVDVLVALDLSESMLAEDLKPNRMRRARHEISGIIDRLQGDRIGLVAFAGASFVQCPLTLDYSAARMFLEFMGTDLIPEPGTGIAEALRVSTHAFDSEAEGFKALILITDGEDHLGDVEAAARDARKAGVRVFTVGIGSETGEPIPLRDEEGQISGYKKDKEDKVILTRLNEEALRKIADITGGLYVRAAGTLGLDRVMNSVEAMEKKELEGGIRVLYEERYSYFVWPAILLLLLQWWIPLRRRVGRWSWDVAGRGALILILSLWPYLALAQTPALPPGGMAPMPGAAGTAPSEGAEPSIFPDETISDEEFDRLLEENQVARAEHPEDPRPVYNLGNLHHLKGDLTQAEEFYAVATGRSEEALASQVAYNLGNTFFRAQKVAEARDAYARALGFDPTNEDAKFNLELAQLILDQAQANPDSTCQNDCQNQDGEQSEDQEKQEQQENQEQQQQQDQEERDEQQQDHQQQEQGEEEQSEAQQQEQKQSPADSLGSAEQMQLMQILKGLEASERELLEQRFQSRSKNTKVEKDW